MGLLDKFAGGGDVLGQALQPVLWPDERLVGSIMATRCAGLLPQTVAVGVTDGRILVASVGGKKGADVLSIERSDISGSSAQAMGLNWQRLAGSNVAKVTMSRGGTARSSCR